MRIDFDSYPINETEIDQSILDIDERKRTSVFAWNGQFSPQFVECMLQHYSSRGEVIYDPFAGSGTVPGEAIRLGISSIAYELNPAAYHMAKIREMSSLDIDKRNEVIGDIEYCIAGLNDENVTKQLSRAFQETTGSTQDAIGLLVILCDFYKNEPTKDLVVTKWEKLREVILKLPRFDGRVDIRLGDARRVHFDDNCADAVLTSPPYINVMNYHQQYRRSVELLGYPVLSIAHSEFGSNRMNRQNRYLTVIEYAVDMGLSLKETSRVVKDGGRLIIVVGKESRVLGAAFSNSRIVWRIANEVLAQSPLLRQQRKFKNRYGKTICEDIIHFENNSCSSIPDSQIVEKCQDIARDELQRTYSECCNSMQENRKELLEKAIKSYRKIGAC